MKTSYLMTALAAPAALACATPATAAIYMFDLTGAYTAAWSIDTDLMMDAYAEEGQGFGFYDVAGVFGGVRRTAASINFFNAANDGGLSIELANGFPFVGYGRQLYAGSEQDFAFRTGSFAFGGSTLTIGSAAAAVPEPATWLTMILGFAAIGLALRARRTTVRFQRV